ncbi:ABATE domain-containing protein [bacterium]|nr:ABATE domain-containing protein [bacterium]
MKSATYKPVFQFVAGNIALDFVNTVGDRLSSKRRDYFKSEKDVVSWIKAAGLSSKDTHKVPLRQVLTFRESLYKIFVSVISSKRPPKSDLYLLNKFVRKSKATWTLQIADGEFNWHWDNSASFPFSMAQVAEAAAELLTSKDLRLLRQCRDAKCGWIFIDRSQGRRRKWCSMKDCGNRAKVRTFLKKSRS